MQAVRKYIIILLITIIIGTNCSLVQANTEGYEQYYVSIIQFIHNMYKDDVNDRKLVESTLKGIFNGLDCYTQFYTSESYLR